MNTISSYLSVWQTRIALGLAFFSAVLVGLWPQPGRPWDPVKLTACVLTGLAWLVAELASAGTVSAHDVSLFNAIRSILNGDALSFLRDHDFSHDLYVASTTPINEISEWHGPDYTFNDHAIQRRWEILFSKICHLSDLYGSNLVSTDGMNLLTAWHLGCSRADQPPQAHAEVRALNEAAAAVYVEVFSFVPFARKRLAL